jgi:uncharacterized protein YeaO (DUF488 family)
VETAVVRLRRAYDPVSDDDGQRILVDRLWPRGVSKERARLDRWAKELSPSKELCEWFDHDPAKWGEFQRRYNAELDSLDAQLKVIARDAEKGVVTLIYGARDEEHNQAVVLKAAIEHLVKKGEPPSTTPDPRAIAVHWPKVAD